MNLFYGSLQSKKSFYRVDYVQEIISYFKKILAFFSSGGGSGLLGSIFIALFGALARFCNDHKRAEPVSKQGIYGFARVSIVSVVVVLWADAVAQSVHFVGPAGLASALAAAYYAAEITEIIKSMLPSIVDKVKNMLERK